MRYTSKPHLRDDIVKEHDALVDLLATIPEARYREPGVWGDGWTVHDLVAHLAEWHRMFLGWHATGVAGGKPDMPAPGYKWNETPRLNRDIQARHRNRGFAEIRHDFEAGYREIVALVDSLSEASLLESGAFAWTGSSTLTTYLGANTASHYRFAHKVLKRWMKEQEL